MAVTVLPWAVFDYCFFALFLFTTVVKIWDKERGEAATRDIQWIFIQVTAAETLP